MSPLLAAPVVINPTAHWDRVKGRSRLSWDEARLATQAAWERVSPWQ